MPLLFEPSDIEIGVAAYARIDLFITFHGPFVVIPKVLGDDGVEVEGVREAVGPGRIDFESVILSARSPREVTHDQRVEPESVLAAVMNFGFDERELQADIKRSVLQA